MVSFDYPLTQVIVSIVWKRTIWEQNNPIETTLILVYGSTDVWPQFLFRAWANMESLADWKQRWRHSASQSGTYSKSNTQGCPKLGGGEAGGYKGFCPFLQILANWGRDMRFADETNFESLHPKLRRNKTQKWVFLDSVKSKLFILW